MKNGEQEAFGFAAQLNGENIYSAGLTKREYFAGLAMQGLLANTELTELNIENLTVLAIEHTDELLKQLEK